MSAPTQDGDGDDDLTAAPIELPCSICRGRRSMLLPGDVMLCPRCDTAGSARRPPNARLAG